MVVIKWFYNLKSDLYFVIVSYLVDQEHLVLLWALSLWVLSPLCHPGHLQRANIIIIIIEVTIFS